MTFEVPPQGPRNARIMLVGEAPGQHEVESGVPFVGPSGMEMTRMLQEAGFTRSQCYVTNVCRVQPPRNDIKKFFGTKASKFPRIMDRSPGPEIQRGLELLHADIRDIDPDLILAFGDTALWGCTGNSGITKWRGSVLESVCFKDPQQRPKVVPTYHPAAILRNWPWRFIAVEDLRRAKRELQTFGRRVEVPPYRFQIRPTFDNIQGTLSELLERVRAERTWISCDIETVRRSHIDCIGLGWSRLDALCIPFITTEASRRWYWTLDEEVEIILMLRELLTHPNCLVIGQNFPYDQQYIARSWGFIPNLQWDTMTIHHSLFSTLPKGLDFQSSMYCEFHQFWKEDAKDAEGKRLSDEDQWIYNARDCVITYECKEQQEKLLEQMNFPSKAGQTPQERQMSFHPSMLSAMLRGVRIGTEKRQEVLADVTKAIKDREEYISHVVGHSLNPRSPKQLQAFFYQDMGLRPINNRKTQRPTTDEAALISLSKREPLVAPVCEFINDVRSLGTFRAVCSTPLDWDQRLRCSYSIPGTDTYRYSSSTDAFGLGTNLQNITAGTKGSLEEMEALAARGVLLKPNLRKLFIPDPGHTIGEYDLPQADAQVVAWECDDQELKEIFRDPERDLHSENAVVIFGRDAYEPGSHQKKVRPEARQYAKIGVHAADYDVSARTLAAALSITIAMAEEFLRKWFKRHPNIKDWHGSIYNQITTRRYIENPFGYRRYVFDRPDNAFKECLAWIPQSVVSIIINTGIREVYNELRTEGVHVLLQVHDSAAYQFPTVRGEELSRRIQELMIVEVPYDDPLIMIPEGKFSEVSWGEIKSRSNWSKAA